MLKDRKIKSRKEVNVGTDGDKKGPWISGCTVMPNGHVVLCDRRNERIKLLDDSFAITGHLELSGPWDVSVIDTSNVIVSLLDKKQLEKVQVFPRMKAVSTIKLDKACWGVVVFREEIYVCHTGPGHGEVSVLDLQGNIKRRLGTNLFTHPYYITVSVSGEKVFVADSWTGTITCMAPSGSVIYTYKDNDIRDPRGLISDSGDNVLVCGWNSDNVHTISPDGSKCHTLLTSQDGLSCPCSIDYKGNEDTLIVGCEYSNELLLFKLA